MSSADDLPAADNSVNLVTCSMSAHWFKPWQPFYQEVDRVLTPGGCLAAYGYGYPVPKLLCHDDPQGDMNTVYTEVRKTMIRFCY